MAGSVLRFACVDAGLWADPAAGSYYAGCGVVCVPVVSEGFGNLGLVCAAIAGGGDAVCVYAAAVDGDDAVAGRGGLAGNVLFVAGVTQELRAVVRPGRRCVRLERQGSRLRRGRCRSASGRSRRG